MALAEYTTQVDWDGSGAFGQAGFPYLFPFSFHTGTAIGDALEDVSEDVKELSWSRGRDAELAKTETGEATITVKDKVGKYIQQNTASDLYDYIRPGRQTRIMAKHNAIVYPLYRGFLDDVLPEPHIEERLAVLPCLDGLDKLSRNRLSSVLQKAKLSGELFEAFLDRAEWDAARRALDNGLDTYPLVFAERAGIRGLFDNIAKSEFGFFYVDGRGYFVWEDRAHRLVAPHTVSQWTATPDLYTNLEPMSSFKTIRNVIILDSQPYIPNAAVVELWRLSENKDNTPADSPALRTGESYDYWAKFDNIADNVINPVATTDYLGNVVIDGSGVDKTAQLTVTSTGFAQSARITVTNNDAGVVYLTLLKMRGEAYDKPRKVEIEEFDQDSIDEFGYSDDLVSLPYYTSTQAMRDMAKYRLGLTKNPWHRYRLTLVGDTDPVLAQILARKLSDRITLQNATYNIDDDFHIEKMEHRVDENGIHRCRWILTLADDQLYWVWDTSTWNFSTRWGY